MLKPQLEDILPENEKLQQYAEDLKKKVAELQEANRKLNREPQAILDQQ